MNSNKIKISICLTFSLVFFITSCELNTKENYIKEFTNFIVDIETNYQTFTEEDWKTKEIEYEKFIGEKYEQFQAQFTDEDQQNIGKLKARYFKIVLKTGIEQLENDIKKGAKQLEGFIEEINSDTNNKINENE